MEIIHLSYLPNYATVTNVINDTVWIETLEDVGGSVLCDCKYI